MNVFTPRVITGTLIALGMAACLISTAARAHEVATTSMQIEKVGINPQPLPPHVPDPEDLAYRLPMEQIAINPQPLPPHVPDPEDLA